MVSLLCSVSLEKKSADELAQNDDEMWWQKGNGKVSLERNWEKKMGKVIV